MYGAMYVVDDLDEYLADPEGYLAKHPLPVQDELLKFNRPRKEWTLAELGPAVESMHHGRSFANGKQMFQVATCVACHKLNGAGQEIGPDLAQLDPKWGPMDVLKELIDPSERINEKYQTWSIETDSGKVVTGLIVAETVDVVRVVENPLASAQPIELLPRQIASRQKVPTSVMPKALLDKLTKEEILDLIAYVAARGDAKHALFQGGHQHGH
jgi:putative heme-binding domain-containing protein